MTTLSSSRPSQKERADVKKQREAVIKDTSERKISVIASADYFRRMMDIKGATGISLKQLMIEAMDDLFDKYSRGDGRHAVGDVAELRRRLQPMK